MALEAAVQAWRLGALRGSRQPTRQGFFSLGSTDSFTDAIQAARGVQNPGALKPAKGTSHEMPRAET